MKTKYDEPNIIKEKEIFKEWNIDSEKDWILIDLSKKVTKEPENGKIKIKSINLADLIFIFILLSYLYH